GFMGRPGEKGPEMTPEVCKSISDRYIELYEHLTGEKFVPAPDADPAKRIETAVLDFIANN
ncbi:MAG: phosphoribosylaminoimidazolesuccinocarboxamide synthase, partial [Muribaculaceae bacterium]|nr:phosphoribosylaminoimidazolesuccinocarboxamide synthase [Muribaculaceae bacterium]